MSLFLLLQSLKLKKFPIIDRSCSHSHWYVAPQIPPHYQTHLLFPRHHNCSHPACSNLDITQLPRLLSMARLNIPNRSSSHPALMRTTQRHIWPSRRPRNRQHHLRHRDVDLRPRRPPSTVTIRTCACGPWRGGNIRYLDIRWLRSGAGEKAQCDYWNK